MLARKIRVIAIIKKTTRTYYSPGHHYFWYNTKQIRWSRAACCAKKDAELAHDQCSIMLWWRLINEVKEKKVHDTKEEIYLEYFEFKGNK